MNEAGAVALCEMYKRDLPPEERRRYDAALQDLKDCVARHGDVGLLALAELAATMSMELDEEH